MAAHLLHLFIKPRAEQEMLPQYNTILRDAALNFPFTRNKKHVHIYTRTCRKDIFPAVFQGAEEKWGSIFVARPTSGTYDDPRICRWDWT